MRTVVVIFAVLLFNAAFVWPTRYAYIPTAHAGSPAAIRTDRLTKQRQLSTYGDMAMHEQYQRMALALETGVLIGLGAGFLIFRREPAGRQRVRKAT